MEILTRAWVGAAQTILEKLHAKTDVLFLVEGDASTYSTFGPLARTITSLDENARVEIVAGVSSFHAAAARLQIPLADTDDTVTVIPAGYGVPTIEHLLDNADTLILLKVKPLLDNIIVLLARRDLLEHSAFLERVGTPDERIVRDVASLQGTTVHYLSLLLVKNPQRERGKAPHGK
ncbi:MAG: precorrin-2/cobalt-factor-2 C20-methyltransferase [Candidatus Kentron sp. G]|nr:MAG: precorrin-2/cobalt-factor-2 C20-methyltransferase [Candidatus Kentron sp. G]VFN02080.1 MAG: precorrin-2/cobalt-factor-2 C20-methyltransferase [Candidatus Kentron sp. G]VFN05049.1 MAG: precorrin-2/cobalt-factor-2 C20-methyltransferase [Candidatus Kentron sp. G]